MAITLVQKNKAKGIMTWYARVPDAMNGTVHYFSLGTTVKTEAKELLQERIKAGTYELKDETQTVTIGEALDRYRDFLEGKGVKANSVHTIMVNLKVLEPLKDRLVSELKRAELSQVFSEASKDLKPITYRNRKTMFTMFFNYLVDVLELLPSNPAKKAIPKRKTPKAERHFWTLEQVQRIIDAARTPETRLLYSLMAYAGLRRSEAVGMNPGKIYGGSIHLVGKGDKPATIPVSPMLQREIDRFGDREWNLKFSETVLQTDCKRALPEGFPGVAHAHRFRHSFGSILIRNNVNVKVVQTLMRHENITLTMDIYGHILDEDTKDAVNKVFK